MYVAKCFTEGKVMYLRTMLKLSCIYEEIESRVDSEKPAPVAARSEV